MRGRIQAQSSVHVPLKKLALCLDCDVCFELALGTCPACGGETWAPLARFLERMASGVLARLVSRANGVSPGPRSVPADGVQQLIIVARDRLALYRHLTRAFGGNRTVRIILDRRGERGRPGARPATTDRRWRKTEEQLRAIGWVVIPAARMADVPAALAERCEVR